MALSVASTSTTTTGTSAAPTANVPTGVANGEGVLCVVFTNTTQFVTAASAAALGFAHAPGSPYPSFGTQFALNVLLKNATGADSGTYAFATSGSDFWCAAASRITGGGGALTWDTNSGIGTAHVDDGGLGSASLNTSMVTQSVNELLVAAGAQFAGGTWTFTGVTKVADVDSTNKSAGYGALLQAAAGATGTITNATAGAASQMVAWLGAIRDGAAAVVADWRPELPGNLLYELAGQKQQLLEPAPTGATDLIDAAVPITATISAVANEVANATAAAVATAATIAAVATEVANATSTVATTATITANATELANATAAVTTTATITAALTVVTGAKTIDATVPITATITATAQEVANATATVPVTATIAATAQEVANAQATVATTATITATAVAIHPIDATQQTTVTITAAALEVANAQASVATTATILAALSVGTAPVAITATVPAMATVTATATEVANAQASVATTATITTAVTAIHPVDIVQLTTVTIAATATEVARAQAAVATAATILAALSVGTIGAGRMASATSAAVFSSITASRSTSATATGGIGSQTTTGSPHSLTSSGGLASRDNL